MGKGALHSVFTQPQASTQNPNPTLHQAYALSPDPGGGVADDAVLRGLHQVPLENPQLHQIEKVAVRMSSRFRRAFEQLASETTILPQDGPHHILDVVHFEELTFFSSDVDSLSLERSGSHNMSPTSTVNLYLGADVPL